MAESQSVPHRTERQLLGDSLREESAALTDALAKMIDSRSESEFGPEAFIEALALVRSVQLELDARAQELLEVAT